MKIFSLQFESAKKRSTVFFLDFRVLLYQRIKFSLLFQEVSKVHPVVALTSNGMLMSSKVYSQTSCAFLFSTSVIK